jgi:hypothetical protein
MEDSGSIFVGGKLKLGSVHVLNYNLVVCESSPTFGHGTVHECGGRCLTAPLLSNATVTVALASSASLPSYCSSRTFLQVQRKRGRVSCCHTCLARRLPGVHVSYAPSLLSGSAASQSLPRRNSDGHGWCSGCSRGGSQRCGFETSPSPSLTGSLQGLARNGLPRLARDKGLVRPGTVK